MADSEIPSVSVSLPSSGSTINAGQLSCAREKYWHEKSAEEKCQKLGEVIESLTQKIRELENKAEDFNVHVHSESGILIPIDADRKNNEDRHYREYFYRNPLDRSESHRI